MPDTIDQKVQGSGNAFSGSGDVHVTHHHYPPGTAPPTPPPPLSNKFDLSRLPTTDSKLFGREKELKWLDQAWADGTTRVLVLEAMGGAGKTALMKTWLDGLAAGGWRGAESVYTWSFYSQGSAEDTAHEFFADALAYFGHDGSPIRSDHDRGRVLAELICRQRTLLVLDGLEPLQHPPGPLNGELATRGCAACSSSLPRTAAAGCSSPPASR